MKKIFALFALFTLVLSTNLYASSINMHIEWTYNGSDDLATQGFRLYKRVGEEKVMVQDIPGGDLRVWDGQVEATVGRSYYYLTAYSADLESPPSKEYPFEYIEPETPGMPAPTVIFRFN